MGSQLFYHFCFPSNRFPTYRILVLVLLLMPFVAFGQDEWDDEFFEDEIYSPEKLFQLQIYSGYEAFSMNGAFYAVTTGEEIDWSPNGTRLLIDQKARDYVYTIGVRLGLQQINDRSNFRHNVFADVATNAFVGPVYMIKGGVFYEPEFHQPGSLFGAFLGIGAGVSHIWANLGDVGEHNSNDTFFETYDGDVYPAGSSISMRSDALFFTSFYMGMRMYLTRYSNVYFLGGYQFSKTADRWHYRIVSSEDGEIFYEFPDNSFPISPNSINQRGTFFRVGITLAGPD